MSAGFENHRHCRLDRSQKSEPLGQSSHDFPLHHDGVEGRHKLADGRITGTDTDVLNCRLLPTDTQPTEGCIEVLRETCAVNCGSQDAFEGRVLPLTRKVGDVVQDIRDKLCNLKPDLTVLNRKVSLAITPSNGSASAPITPKSVT